MPRPATCWFQSGEVVLNALHSRRKAACGEESFGLEQLNGVLGYWALEYDWKGCSSHSLQCTSPIQESPNLITPSILSLI